jgi:hypothetical protein
MPLDSHRILWSRMSFSLPGDLTRWRQPPPVYRPCFTIDAHPKALETKENLGTCKDANVRRVPTGTLLPGIIGVD